MSAVAHDIKISSKGKKVICKTLFMEMKVIFYHWKKKLVLMVKSLPHYINCSLKQYNWNRQHIYKHMQFKLL